MRKKLLILIPAALLIAGVTGARFVYGSAHAQTPHALVTQAFTHNAAGTGVDTDKVESGDQTAPDVAGATEPADTAAEATTPETSTALDPAGADVGSTDTGTADTGTVDTGK